MKKQLLALAMGCCALAANGQNAPVQPVKDLTVKQSFEVVGVQHFQDITFELQGNEAIQGITLSQEGTPKIITHGHYIVKQEVTEEEAANGIRSWIAFPTDMQAATDNYGKLWTAYSYNPNKEYAEAWEMVTPTNGRLVFKAGVGYQIRYDKNLSNGLTIEFKSVIKYFGSNDCRSTGLNRHYNTYNADSEWANLRLVGAPFMSATRLNTTDVRLAFPNEKGGYDQYVSTDNATPDMAPFRAFFVQHAGDVLYKGVNNTTLEMGPVYAHTVGDEFLNIYLKGNGSSDRTVLWLSENSRSNYESSDDFSKLFSGEEQYATIYSLENGHRLAYNKMGYTTDVIPMGVRIPVKGTYTFSLNGAMTAASQVILHDKVRNTYTDLKQRDYTFTANTGTLDNRFELNLNFAPITTPSIDNEGSGMTLDVLTTDRGIVINGLPEGTTIQLADASGKVITRLYADSETMTLPQLVPGIYFLMVNHNNEFSSHKLTVK